MSGTIGPISAPAASRPFLFGRQRERTSLRQALGTTLDGHGSLILVSGEAGIGKTTLVEDLAWQASERGGLVLSGGCFELNTSPPYGPWLNAFDSYSSTKDLPTLPPSLQGCETGESGSPNDLFRQAQRFLETLSARVPLVLILEDLHWADQPSLDLLRDLSRRISHVRVMLIVTWRVDELNRRHHLYRLIPTLVREAGGVRLDLRPLGKAAQRALIAARYQLASVDRERLATYLRQHVDGNPFFLTELLRTLEEESLLTRNGSDQWHLGDLSQAPVPELVRQVIEARVLKLGDDVRDLVDMAAVIGHEIPLDLWTSLIDIDHERILTVFERMLDARLVREVPPNGYRFNHALVREAIYDGILLPKRQMMHRAVADILAARSNPDPDLMAYHLRQAADPQSSVWLLRSGVRARQQFAPRAAIERLTEALKGDLSDQERIEAYLERGRAYETLGELSASVADAEVALHLARAVDDWRIEWQTLLDLGTAWAPSNYERAGAFYRQALDLARERGDQVAHAVSLNRLGNWCFNVLRLSEALELHQEALGIIDTLNDLSHLAETHDALAMCWWANGDSFQAGAHWDTAIDLFARLGQRQRLASSVATSTGLSLIDFMVVATRPEAYAWNQAERALDLSREIEWRPGEIFALFNVARLRMLRGEMIAAENVMEEAQVLAESIGHREWSTACWWIVGQTHGHLSDLDYAKSAFERALDFAHQIGSSFWTYLTAASLVRVLVERRDLDEAQSVFDTEFGPADDEPDARGSLHDSHRRNAEAALALARGNASHALDIIDKTLSTMPNLDRGVVPAHTILRAQALRQLGRLEEARDEFVAARRRLTEFNERPTRLIACAELGRVYLALGRAEEAQAAFDEARELAGFINDHISDPGTRAGFQSFVEALFSHDGTGSGAPVTPLSTRELEVLKLVAEGLTDVEVARRLFLSRRTVSSHLRSIYNKLGVSTRTAATRLAIEQHII